MNVPPDLRYAKTHEWLRLQNGEATVGITDHAQEELTDIVYVELPEAGATFRAGTQICVVESVKAASDIYAPISGTVTAINEALKANPALVNTDPYGEGWIFKLKAENAGEAEALLSPADYTAQLAG